MKIPRIKPGHRHISAVGWNAMAERAEAFGKSNGVGFNSPAGLALNHTPQPISVPAWFHVLSVQDDYLTCSQWTGGTSDYIAPIYVAKPYSLRRSPFDGWTINGLKYVYSTSTKRSVTKTSNSEGRVESVTPAWVLPDTAANNSSGATATYPGDLIKAQVFDPVPGIMGADNNPIVWVDTNDAGRIWSVTDTTFLVTVQKTGGSDGTQTAAASWTYTVKDLSGTVTLGTGVGVARPRSNGSMTAQSGSSGVGLAYYDASGNLQLWDAGEVPNTGACS